MVDFLNPNPPNWSKEDYILATNITRGVIYIGIVMAVISLILIIKFNKVEKFYRWIFIEIFACALVCFPYLLKVAGGLELVLGYSTYELQMWRLFLPTYTVYLVMQIILTIYEFKEYKRESKNKGKR